MDSKLPVKNQMVLLRDFFQVEVDDFNDGYFKFLSVEKIKPKLNDSCLKNIDSVSKYGWVIHLVEHSTYKNNFDVLICDYKIRPWHNHYHAQNDLAAANGCDKTIRGTLDDFIDWIEILNDPIVSQQAELKRDLFFSRARKEYGLITPHKRMCRTYKWPKRKLGTQHEFSFL